MRRRPTPTDTPGLLGAYTMITAPLSEKVLGTPQLGRFGLPYPRRWTLTSGSTSRVAPELCVT